MNSREAQEILRLDRPETRGTPDAAEPGILAHAREVVAGDPDLARWHTGQLAFHAAMRRRLRAVEAPAELRERILAGCRPAPAAGPDLLAVLGQRLRAWGQLPRARAWSATALVAAVVLVVAAGLVWRRPAAPGRGGEVAAFRDRMVRTALRNYRMDLLTRDTGEIRDYLKRRDAHGDFVLPPGLQPLPGAGCAVLSWNGHPVSMICLVAPPKKEVYLFVIDGAEVSGPAPGSAPELRPVNRLNTATWTAGGKTYVLAAPLEPAELQRLL